MIASNKASSRNGEATRTAQHTERSASSKLWTVRMAVNADLLMGQTFLVSTYHFGTRSQGTIFLPFPIVKEFALGIGDNPPERTRK
jgi:hypothetical protein